MLLCGFAAHLASVEETLYDLLSQEADVDSIMYDFINK